MFSKLTYRLHALLREAKLERELNEEMRYHLEREVEASIRRGLSPEEARRVALVNFGGVERIKEEWRDARSFRLIEALWQNLRYSGRMLRKKPGFTLVAVLTLALGIGATTAIFSVVYATLFEPLPYPKPDQLVMVWSKVNQTRNSVSAGDYLKWRTIQSNLYGVSALDLRAFSGVAVVLLAAALLACYFPARRAARVDPLVALREE